MKRREILKRTAEVLGASLGVNALTVLAAQAKKGEQGRRPVIPKEVIEQFDLRPSEGYGLWVLGEDGRPYALDDVLRVIFEMTKEHWQRLSKMQMRKK